MTDDPTHAPNDEAAGPINSYVFAQSIDLLLRMFPVCAEPFDGDLTRMLVFYSAARASVGHLNHRNQLRTDAVGGVFPDDLRRPVSVLSLSEFLRLPYETVRRHMHALVEAGWCERHGKKEFFVPSHVMKSEIMARSIAGAVPAIFEFSSRIATLPRK